ncbi:amino acid ABC transporter membrane protein 2, PAAT family [Geodermatophilus amargosae]|jgi:glutamate transport system permease protein|uniref:Amino acid ABC transporter membrane protein 2, PAAT family n=1 Tax=Geodermatophilus amargosae TaxID=1296565 RepID=A0A1I6ZSG2_9ACTN|nr:amino acid ABC transporter permease [Geodermatophilus amargosae]SFT65505.1 amino acid ABC transporter membrane protein 2, PAAT family [Geodermatophilus amargosae]
MSTSSVLFDLPGPRARRRQRIGTVVGLLVVAGLVALALWRLGSNGQLEGSRWAILFDTRTNVPQRLLSALVDTLKVAAVGMVAATVLGALLAVGRLSDHLWVRIPVTVVVEFFRAVPLLVLILFCLLFLPVIGIPTSAFFALALGLTLYNMAVLSEIFRAGILSVDRGQREAAFALGMRKSQVMSLVLVPQAVRRMLPVLVAQLVVLLKDSSLGFIVAYPELLRTARSLVETLNFQFGPIYTFQLYVAAGVIYIVVNVLLSWLARVIERRTQRSAKAAAVEDVELPADVQMGGGGGAITKV